MARPLTCGSSTRQQVVGLMKSKATNGSYRAPWLSRRTIRERGGGFRYEGNRRARGNPVGATCQVSTVNNRTPWRRQRRRRRSSCSNDEIRLIYAAPKKNVLRIFLKGTRPARFHLWRCVERPPQEQARRGHAVRGTALNKSKQWVEVSARGARRRGKRVLLFNPHAGNAALWPLHEP